MTSGMETTRRGVSNLFHATKLRRVLTVCGLQAHKLRSVWNPVVFGALEFHRTRHEFTCRGCSNTGEDPTKHCYTSDALIQELSELSLMKEFSPSEPNSVMPDSPTGIGADACRATVQ